MTNTSQAESLIAFWEAKKLKAYKDIAGVWSIGYGSTFNYDANRPVLQSDVIDDATALRWLRHEIANKKTEIKKLVKVPLSQNQIDSLTSFAYNIGINAFKNSTLLKLLNAGNNKLMVADQFMIWNKITKDGKKIVSNGLTNRRKAERELFLK